MSATVTPSHDQAKARAVGWLTAWDSQGIHRTATSGDEAGALWLAGETARLGAVVASEAFALVRLEPVACYLELDGVRISGVPAFDAAATSDDGVAGRLSFNGREQSILVAELTPQSGLYWPIRQAAALHRTSCFGYCQRRRAPRHGRAKCRAVPRTVRRAGDTSFECRTRSLARGRLTRCNGPASKR